MESIDQRLAKIDQRLERMDRMLSILVREKNKEKKANEWLPEDEAAKLFNWSIKYLRAQAKAGKVPIRYKNIRGRSFSYLKSDVENFLKQKL